MSYLVCPASFNHILAGVVSRSRAQPQLWTRTALQKTVCLYSMEFDVFRCRNEGQLLPRHVMWSTKVRGELYVTEERDDELHRTVRVAMIKDQTRNLLIEPLRDVVVVGAKPDWWTLTGWERPAATATSRQRAFQQSWVMIPADRAE